eukprot:6534114-Ditylum_brightwellii.AAC.1
MAPPPSLLPKEITYLCVLHGLAAAWWSLDSSDILVVAVALDAFIVDNFWSKLLHNKVRMFSKCVKE